MKHDRLLDAIGEIRDEYVEEGAEAKPTGWDKGRVSLLPWKKLGGLAAALMVVVGLGLSLSQLNQESTTSGASQDVAVTAAEEAAEEALEEAADAAAKPEAGEETLEAPPTLTIVGQDLVLYPENYAWTVGYGEEAPSILGCGMTVLEEADTISVVHLSGEDHFSFQTEGRWTEVTALCYPETSWGDDDAAGTPLGVEGNTVTLPDGEGSWILSLNLTWTCDSYSGSAEYHLFVTQD